MLKIALPKGRMGDRVYAMFESIGYPCREIKEDNRKLVFRSDNGEVSYVLVKPSDVTVYVERGAADIGVVGKDVMLETRPDVYEILDLNIGKCRIAVAGKVGFKDDPSLALRVATKYPHIAKKYYDSLGRKIDIIELHGSIDLSRPSGSSVSARRAWALASRAARPPPPEASTFRSRPESWRRTSWCSGGRTPSCWAASDAR